MKACYYLLARLTLSSLALSSIATAATPPDLSGVWQVSAAVRELKTTDGKAPPLLPDAQKTYDERRAQLKQGKASFDTTQRCKPMGQPRIMYDSKDFPFDIVQTPKKIFIGYQWNRQPRHIYIDENHSGISPVFYGYSSGRWEGNTLVVQVVGIDDSTLLDASGLPHSDAMKLTERYQLKNNGQQLEVRYSFDDPSTFSKNWDAVVTFNKIPNGRVAEDICVDRLKLFSK
ncbi:MAG: hypothetical protein QM808_03285 [Steroidobacteraceae bacterium]